jgi:diadenosine tetraphosphate (Ap4A) HIT family hydrolase
MHDEQCVSCATLAGQNQPPGGIVYEDAYWVFFLRSRPLLVPGQGFILLKRHCERLHDPIADFRSCPSAPLPLMILNC